MMRLLFILSLFLSACPFLVHAQLEKKEEYTDVYRTLEEKAKPDYNWMIYLNQNLQYPEAARKNNIQGMVGVEFIVEKDGSISQPRIVRGREIGYGIPEEALRVINNAPKWKPGRQKNQPVRSYFTLPVTFSLPPDQISSEKEVERSLTPVPSGGMPERIKKEEEVDVFRAVPQKAQPMVELNGFFARNIRYPKAAKEAEVWGRVYIEVVVEKDGTLTNFRVVKGKELGYGIPEEAVRVVKTLPKWKPARQNGAAVRSYFLIPVSFKLK